MIETPRIATRHYLSILAATALACSAAVCLAQAPAPPPPIAEKALPGLDLSSIDPSADPCADMYKFACGKFAANHPIPADQPEVDPFYVLFNIDTQQLNTILQKAEEGGASRSPDEQKIGDYFKACMDTSVIQSEGLTPLKPLLDRIDALTPASRAQLAALIGDLQRYGVNVFFGYGEQQDYKDATKQIAFIQQGGLGLPEKDYYLRTGDKDVKIRAQYVAHVAKMLTLAGSTPEQAQKDAKTSSPWRPHSPRPRSASSICASPRRPIICSPLPPSRPACPASASPPTKTPSTRPTSPRSTTPLPTTGPRWSSRCRPPISPPSRPTFAITCSPPCHATCPTPSMTRTSTSMAASCDGQPEQRARWKRCSNAVNGALGEALGKVYVDQYFAGDSKAKMLADGPRHRSRHGPRPRPDRLDVARDQDRAKEKLAAVANKIGYPDKWRDYSKLTVKPDDPLGNELRANAFENDRELNKIGKPVDKGEWEMTPPTVNAYYDSSMNDINFPAGILQPPFYDRTQDDRRELRPHRRRHRP